MIAIPSVKVGNSWSYVRCGVRVCASDVAYESARRLRIIVRTGFSGYESRTPRGSLWCSLSFLQSKRLRAGRHLRNHNRVSIGAVLIFDSTEVLRFANDDINLRFRSTEYLLATTS